MSKKIVYPEINSLWVMVEDITEEKAYGLNKGEKVKVTKTDDFRFSTRGIEQVIHQVYLEIQEGELSGRIRIIELERFRRCFKPA